MGTGTLTWQQWKAFFEERSGRPLPRLEVQNNYGALPASLAKSLAIFQLGESGGGTVILQATNCRLPDIDADYASSVELFVEEEHRHANILAMCVRMLGGKLIRKNWTAALFVFARRLMGLRLKVVVLLAAELIGICYYHLLASKLPDSPLRDLLLQLVEEEKAHLQFHCDFLRSQAYSPWRRRLFVLVWRVVYCCAGFVVAIDHRPAIRDLEIGIPSIVERWMYYGRLAERFVVSVSQSELLGLRLVRH